MSSAATNPNPNLYWRAGKQNYDDQGVRSIAWVQQSGRATYRYAAPSAVPSAAPSLKSRAPHAGVELAATSSAGADVDGGDGALVRELAALNPASINASGSSPVPAALYSYLWICEEDSNRVYVVDVAGVLVETIKVKKPIGIYVSYEKGVVLIGSKGKKKEGGGGVTAFDIASRHAVRSFALIGLNHPTGLLLYDNVVYVADQSAGAIFLFDFISGRFVKNIYPHGADSIEQIFLTTC